MNSSLFDAKLLGNYDKSGPRYTSYPTAVHFSDEFDENAYRNAAIDSNGSPAKALSIYYHIPFCSTLCFYCACNKIVTKNKGKANEYLNYLYKEIECQAKLYSTGRSVTQLHLGGGTPTFLSIEQIDKLLQTTGKYFSLTSGQSRDYSIEIDPRSVEIDAIHDLWSLGFNRLSLGVQDFDPAVQKAVHRIQPEEKTLEMINTARDIGFQSTNVDLIYGLPLQTAKSFARTVNTIIEAAPERLSIFNYAHMPQYFYPQKRINEQDLPNPTEKLEMFRQFVETLTEAGYVYIGMDHFAKPSDSLVTARDARTLHRNFQGYASHADCDLVGMGVTSISKVANSYSQNTKTLDEYYQMITENRLPVVRGINLNSDDLMRRDIIESLMCYGELTYSCIEKRHNIEFREHFANELIELGNMESDGLLEIGPERILVLNTGRFLIRNISMVFDAYQNRVNGAPRFSRLI